MAKITYRGFSSSRYLATKQSMLLTNIALVKRDLLNHIFTRQGERVMNPKFGTVIPDLLFEPIDEQTIKIVRNELARVFGNDPRVKVLDMSVYAVPDSNALIASAVLEYIELDAVDRFDLEVQFNNQM